MLLQGKWVLDEARRARKLTDFYQVEVSVRLRNNGIGRHTPSTALCSYDSFELSVVAMRRHLNG
jgi:hypothetical protein